MSAYLSPRRTHLSCWQSGCVWIRACHGGKGRKKGVPNKATADLKAAFQKHGDELVDALLALTKSDDERVRLGAIQACLDRGWGKSAQTVAVGGDPTAPIIFEMRFGDGLRSHKGRPARDT